MNNPPDLKDKRGRKANKLSTYLKQKNYQINEGHHKRDLVLTQSAMDHDVSESVSSDISRSNFFSYSNIFSLNSHPALVDQQFSKLAAFVAKQRSIKVKTELEQMLPPLLCHLYIEMLKGKEWKVAIDFLRKYAVILGPLSHQQRSNGIAVDNATTFNSSPIVFATSSSISSNNNNISSPPRNPQAIPLFSQHLPHQQTEKNATQALQHLHHDRMNKFRELVHILSRIQSMQDVDLDKLASSFRSCKCEIQLSEKTANVLKFFLTNHGHVLILQIITVWFHVQEDPSLQDQLAIEDEDSELDSEIEDLPDPELRLGSRHSSHQRDHKVSNSSRNINQELNCDNPKDIEQYSASVNFDNNGATADSSNLKLKRLQQTFKLTNENYHMPIRIFNINQTNNSLCSVNVDKSHCHLAGGFEDSSIVLWSLSSYENFGRKPYRTFDDRLCQWSINNCNRHLTDDLSDYSSDTDEEDLCAVNYRIEQESEEEEGERQTEAGTDNTAGEPDSGRRKKVRFNNKYRRRLKLKDRWQKYTFRSCSENSYSSNQSIVLRGHRKAVTDVKFSNLHPILLSVSRDTTLRAWHADTYTCASVYRGHNSPIWCLDESSNGGHIATGSKDTTARLWSLERKFPLRTYAGHTQDIDCIAFHPNGNYLSTGSTDTTVRLWCVTSGRLLRIFTECHLPVNTISFSPNGKLLAAGGDESKIRIFDLAAGHQLADLKHRSSSVKSLCWSNDSQKLLAGCADGNFYAWNINMLGNNLPTSSSSSAGASSGVNQKDVKPSTSAATSSTSTAESSNKSSSAPSTSSHSKNTSSSKSTLQHSMLQSNATGCTRLLKILFDRSNSLINCIGND